VTRHHLALTSDGVKYVSVAVGEHDDRDCVVKQESVHRVSLRQSITGRDRLGLLVVSYGV